MKKIPITAFDMEAIKEVYGNNSYQNGWRKPEKTNAYYQLNVIYVRTKQIKGILYEVEVIDHTEILEKRPFSVQLTKWFRDSHYEDKYQAYFSDKTRAFQKAKDLMTKVNEGVIV